MLDRLNKLVGLFGYPKPIRSCISIAPVDMNLDISGSVAPRTRFNGDITTKSGSEICQRVRLHGDVTIEDSVRIGRNSELRGKVTVGRYSNFVRENWVQGDVTIGQFCAIAPKAAFQGTNHDIDHWALQQRWQREELHKKVPPEIGPITVGSDVWVGREAIILSDVNIGHGACIGAGSIVTRDVPPYAIVAGVPAKQIGWRFPKTVREELLNLSWWEWEIDEIKARSDEIQQIVEQE